jgi:hypothetical protein
MSMNISFVALLAVFLCLVAAAVFRQSRIVRLRHAEQSLDEVLATCRQLLALAISLQQHRGMSSAWLSGDAAFLPRLRSKQKEIAALLPELLRSARREAERNSPCFTGNEVSLFIFHWESLLETLASRQPEQSIAEHSHLITRVLDWLAALGEARIEPLAGQHRQIGLARNYAYRLPALAEALGQARAVGSGVAARQACSPVARVRLMFLISRAEALLEQAVQANDGGRFAAQVRSSLQQLANTVRTSMLLSDGVRVSPEDYFAMASRTIDAIFAWVEDSGSQLRRLSAVSPELTGARPVAG